MRTVRLPLLRGALFIIALAAIAIIMARGDNPAAATSFEPVNSVRVSDPTPGANADIIIDFSLNSPDAFPNVKSNPAIQFLPRQWEIAAEPKIGAIGGTFNALVNLGLMGYAPCGYPLPVNFTMIDATTDTSNLASSLDLGGDAHPGGPGFSGQFVDDPDTLSAPGDMGLSLVRFNANEKWAQIVNDIGVYRDLDSNSRVSAGDLRLTYLTLVEFVLEDDLPPGVVQAGDWDAAYLWPNGTIGIPIAAFQGYEKHTNPDGNSQMDAGENAYQDWDWNNRVSFGDVRLFRFPPFAIRSVVRDFALPGGVTRYPDFLNQMFQMFGVVGKPLARQFGQRSVLGSPVSMNIVTFRPGQLPGYPATLGYANVVVLLNPVAPIDASIINLTSDLCTDLSLTSTNFGVSHDNPATLEDERGHVRLTNPKAEKGEGSKPYVFTLVTTSQPDADNDNIENMLDSCPLAPNIHDLDGRGNPWGGDFLTDPDLDGLDAACDPEETPPPDLGAGLIAFNANERFIDRGIYRDNDGNNLVSPGDDRLSIRTMWWGGAYHDLQPGVVQDSDADYRNPATGNVRATWARQLTAFRADDKHAENVAENGRYDVGEDVIWDVDGSNDVSLGDYRLLVDGQLAEGRFFAPIVSFWRTSPLSPFFYVPDEDQDNFGNRADNCPTVANGIEVLGMRYVQLRDLVFNVLTYGDLIGPSNQADTDGDDLGDACDPDPYTVTGHMHPAVLPQAVTIARHGVKLDDFEGPGNVASGGAAVYSVAVENKAGSDYSEVAQVGLKVAGGCGTVNGVASQNTTTLSLNPDQTKTASFTVDFSTCADGEYVVQADACHAGDAAPAGLFGEGACPGASDGLADTNQLDDVYMSMFVEVGP